MMPNNQSRRTPRKPSWTTPVLFVLGFGASLLSACGNGDTCSQCGPTNGGTGGNAGSSSGGNGGTVGGGGGTGGSNVSQAVQDYCECMLDSCHDDYHRIWGEDHIAAEEQCHAEASLVPEHGSPTDSGNFIECRLAACQRATQDATACTAALGDGACSAN